MGHNARRFKSPNNQVAEVRQRAQELQNAVRKCLDLDDPFPDYTDPDAKDLYIILTDAQLQVSQVLATLRRFGDIVALKGELYGWEEQR